MPNPTLTDIFPGASQTTTEIVIPKALLTAQGLTATANNSGESIVGAIIKHLATTLTQSALDADSDRNIYVQKQVDSTTFRGDGTQRREYPYYFYVQTPYIDSAFDPDEL